MARFVVPPKKPKDVILRKVCKSHILGLSAMKIALSVDIITILMVRGFRCGCITGYGGGVERRRKIRTMKKGENMEWEQYEKLMPKKINEPMTQVDVKCPKCGKKIWRRNDIVLTTYPAQYQYECECGWIGYAFI